jgi:formate hydrogenlyase transcriptional activator
MIRPANADHVMPLAASQEQSTATRDQYRALFAVSDAIASHRDRDSLFHQLAIRLGHVMQFEVLSLVLYDEATNIMRRHILEGTQPLPPPTEMVFDLVDDPARFAWQTQQPYIAANVDQLKRWPKYFEFVQRYGGQCFCYLPLTTARRRLGVLVFGSRQSGTYDGADVHFLQLVANQVAVAVENAMAFHEIESLKDKLAKEKAYLEQEVRTEQAFGDIVGESPALRSVLKHVATVSPTDSTVLLCGETGTGKELIARAVHDRSPRAARTFVKVNCAAIPTGLLESELFGHEKGAFTGAINHKIGRFELAHQGTLFLDEVGDIPLELQPKLLRVLQEQEFERLGSTRTIRVNVRLVAATNRDLARMVADGQFRSDLYYRLNVFPITLPPLRQRRDDIPRLVRHFTQRFSQRMGRHIQTITSDVMDALVSYAWPGNVRELQNVIERAVILSNGPTLMVCVGELRNITTTTPAATAPPQLASAPVTLNDAEREHILSTLAATNWVIGGAKGAAARLGMKRSTLQKKMQKLGISRPA